MKQQPDTSLLKVLSLTVMLAALLACPAPAWGDTSAAAPAAAAPVVAPPAKPALHVGSGTVSMHDAASRMMKGLIYTVAALGLALTLVKRIKGSSKKLSHSAAIEVLTRRNLSSRVSLVLIEVEGRRLLLSQGPEEARLITELASSGDGFEDLLGSAQGFVEELPRAVHE